MDRSPDFILLSFVAKLEGTPNALASTVCVPALTWHCRFMMAKSRGLDDGGMLHIWPSCKRLELASITDLLSTLSLILTPIRSCSLTRSNCFSCLTLRSPRGEWKKSWSSSLNYHCKNRTSLKMNLFCCIYIYILIAILRVVSPLIYRLYCKNYASTLPYLL